MKNLLALLTVAGAILAAGLVAGFAVAATNDKPPAPPGQVPCSHGSTGKECKPDPSPNGKDCEPHGKKGGVNEDHCRPRETTTTTTTGTTETTTTEVTTSTSTSTSTASTSTETTTTAITSTQPTSSVLTTTTALTTSTETESTSTTTGATPTPGPTHLTQRKAKPKRPKDAPPGMPPLCPLGKTYVGKCAVRGSG